MKIVILALFSLLGLIIIAGIVASMCRPKPKRTRAEILRGVRRACQVLDA